MFILFLTLLFKTTISFAVVSNVVVDGGSTEIQISPNQWRVYGSFLGPTGNSDTDTFNSCTIVQATFGGCNRNRVIGSTILTVSFNDDIQFIGPRRVIAYLQEVNNATTPVDTVNAGGNFTQGANFNVSIRWDELCDAAGGTMNNATDVCEASGVPLNKNIQLFVGVQSDQGNLAANPITIDLRIATPDAAIGLFNPAVVADVTDAEGFSSMNGCEGALGSTVLQGVYTGFCDYKLLPGDEKIRIGTDLNLTNALGSNGSGTITAANSYNVPVSGFILYLSNVDFDNALPWNASKSFTNTLNTNGSIGSGFQKSEIKSSVIKNDLIVYSRMATLDEAGNITHLFGDNIIDQNCPLPAPAAPEIFEFFVGQPVSGPPYDRCPYATIPSLVTGLLEEDVNCFIATALHNSPYHYQVLTLRTFRNEILNSFSWGQSFVNYYYKVGPKYAQWLNQNPEYKPIFRVLLWPAYLIAKVFLNFGIFLGLVFLIIPLAFVLFFRFYGHSVITKAS